MTPERERLIRRTWARCRTEFVARFERGEVCIAATARYPILAVSFARVTEHSLTAETLHFWAKRDDFGHRWVECDGIRLRAAPRTGSCPLMNLADDWGVDYGDVLLAADGFRMALLDEEASEARTQACAAARRRLYSEPRGVELVRQIIDHAKWRWGRHDRLLP